MFLSNREIPEELLHYNAVSKRRHLTKEEQYKMNSIKKGFEGECLYDQIFKETGYENVYIFRDVYLKIDGLVTQYDSIVISDYRVAVNEIKNYQGDFHYEKANWFKNGYLMEDDAFSQLRRAKGKLMKLSKISGEQFDVDGSLIFINDDFRLTTEETEIWDRTITRSHLRNYLRNLNSRQRSGRAKKIANIINNYIVSNIYFDKQESISDLKRGLYCGGCLGFDLEKRKFHFKCNTCGTVETKETHLLRAISDYKFIFYKQPITIKLMMAFIDFQIQKTTVHRVLKKYCEIENKGRQSKYNFNYYDLTSALSVSSNRRYKDRLIKMD